MTVIGGATSTGQQYSRPTFIALTKCITAVSVRIDLNNKRKCSACGAMESGRILFEALGDNTFFDVGIIGRPKVKGERKIVTGEGIAVQAFACLLCGHLDFYFEVVAPVEKAPGTP
jgi:hypothetical protein